MAVESKETVEQPRKEYRFNTPSHTLSPLLFVNSQARCAPMFTDPRSALARSVMEQHWRMPG
jgi:hypothetical protein